MRMHVRRGTKAHVNKLLFTGLAVLALLVQPMYGLVASKVASALAATVSSQSELVAKIADISIDTIDIDGSFTVSSQININRTLTLNGNGATLSAASGWNGTGSNDSILAVTGGNPTINNLIVDGAAATNTQGIQVWQSAATLNDVIARNSQKAGIHANASTVNATNITTANNSRGKSVFGIASFGGILVSAGGTLNIGGLSTHTSEGNHIRRDSGTVNDLSSQYNNVAIFYTLKPAPAVPVITSPTEAQNVVAPAGDVTITWNAVAGAHSYLVAIDGGAPSPVIGGTIFPATLTEGTHTVMVQSVAQSGLTGGTSQVRNFTVTIPDTTPPTLNITSPSDGDTVRTRMSSTINVLKVNGTFTDESGGYVELQLVGHGHAPVITTHAPVVNGELAAFDTTGFPDGQYELLARGTDYLGNALPEQVRNVTIDNTGPAISKVSPADNTRVSKLLNLEFDVTDPSGVGQVNIHLFQGNVSKKTIPLTHAGGNRWVATNANVADLADGEYTFISRAVDNLGNLRADSMSTHGKIIIDNTAPLITSVAFNKMNTFGGVNYTGAATVMNNGKLDITFTTNEPLRLVGSQVGFRIPGFAGPPATGWTKVELVDAATNKYVAHIDLFNRTDTSNPSFTPNFFAGKTIKDISLYFRVIDALGNTDSTYYLADGSFGKMLTNLYKFTLDNTNPQATVSVTPLTNGYGKGTLQVTGLVDPAEENVQTHWFEIKGPGLPAGGKLVGDIYSSPAVSRTANEYVFNWDTTGLNGTYTIRYVATDKAGNRNDCFRGTAVGCVDSTAILTVTIDNTNPTISASLSDTLIGGGDANPTLTLVLNDALSGIDYSQYRILDAAAQNMSGHGWVDVESGDPVDVSGLADGEYVLRARTFDNAGNKKSGADVRFIVDRTAPAVTVSPVATSTVTTRTITGTVTDNNTVVGVEVSLDGGATWYPATTFDGTNWTYEATGLAVATHTVIARATDEAGNVSGVDVSAPASYWKSFAVQAITTPPSNTTNNTNNAAPETPSTERSGGNNGSVLSDPAVDVATVGNDADTNDNSNTVVNPSPTKTDNTTDARVLGAQDEKAQLSLVNAVLAGIITLMGVIALAGIRRQKGNHTVARVLTLAPVVAAIVAFFLVETITSSIAWVNVWTWLFAGILAVQVILTSIARRTANNE